MSCSVTHSFYFDKCVPAVHGLSRGQTFGHVFSGSLEGALSQTFPQCFGIHLRQQGSTIRKDDLLTLAVSSEKTAHASKSSLAILKLVDVWTLQASRLSTMVAGIPQEINVSYLNDCTCFKIIFIFNHCFTLKVHIAQVKNGCEQFGNFPQVIFCECENLQSWLEVSVLLHVVTALTAGAVTLVWSHELQLNKQWVIRSNIQGTSNCFCSILLLKLWQIPWNWYTDIMVTETMTIKIFNLVKLEINLVDFSHLLHVFSENINKSNL